MKMFHIAFVTVEYASEIIMFVSGVRIISISLLGGYLYLTAIVAYKFGTVFTQ